MLATAAISELTEHVYFPILEQLSHRILYALGYHDIIGDRILINTDWSTHSLTSDIDKNARLGQEMFKVDAQLQLNPTSPKWDFYTFHHTAAYGISKHLVKSTAPIYNDRINDVTITDIITPVTIMLNCELILKSADLAFQTPLRIFNGYENGAIIHFNDLFFDYPLPHVHQSILYGLWKLDRDFGARTGRSFLDFIQLHTAGGWQLHKHRDKEEYEIVIPVTDLQSLATLEYSEDRPQGVMKDRLPIGFSIPFIYTVQFALPNLVIMDYPIVYQNQLIPKEYLPIELHQRFTDIKGGHKGKADEGYARICTRDRRHTSHMRIPFYDDWFVPRHSPISAWRMVPIETICVLIDEDNYTEAGYKTVINLDKDLKGEDGELTPLVKEFLYQQGKYSLYGDVLFNVSVYKGDKILNSKADVKFNRDLEVTFYTTNLYVPYRIVISMATYLYNIDYRWTGLLKKWYAVLPEPIKSQVKMAVEHDRWHDPDLPKDVELRDDGWIYYQLKKIRHITELKNPRRGNAYHTPTRIIEHSIFPRAAH